MHRLLAAETGANRQIQDDGIKGTLLAHCHSVSLDRALSILHQDHFLAHAPEQRAKDFPHLLLVIHHQDLPGPWQMSLRGCLRSFG